MFNSFLSKFKTILESDKTSVKVPTKPSGQEKAKATIKEKETDKSEDLNRVVFSPQKSEVKEEIPDVKANIILENAHRIEAEVKSKEAEIKDRLHSIEDKEKYLFSREQSLDSQNTEVKKKLDQIDELYRKQLEKLENISGLDINKAKELLMSSVEKKMANWVSKKIDETKDDLTSRQEEISREILSTALTHGVTDYVAEYTVSTISLPDEKIKGKIIGREGRNIRAFEKATGVEIELDETNDIRISSFDSTRREIARLSLEKLIKDGRIQPVKIEQVVAQTKSEMDKILLDEGKRICQEVGVYNLPVDLIKQIGKYKFRYSYGQKLAKHTIEAVKIATALAHEFKADVNTVRLGTLLHDVGKVINDEEGTHIELGVNLLRRYKLPEAVINAVAEHHEDKPFSSVESVLVYLGDAASGARPGARYEVHEEYLKRMQNIEEIAKDFPGVTSVAAYQAGREVMVIVEPSVVNDDEATVLSQNIAEKLEEEAKWAGQIKVTVVRELRTSSTIIGSKLNKNAEKNED